jgi:hypothetical protein
MSCAILTARASFLASQQARQCQKHGLCGVLAPQKTAVVAVHRHRLLTSQVCRPPLGMSESFTAPILGLQDNFRCHPRGWRRGCCTCYGCTYPLKPGVGVAKMGLSSNRFCLDGLAGGNRGGPCTRRFQHTSTLSPGVWLRVGVARVVRA